MPSNNQSKNKKTDLSNLSCIQMVAVYLSGTTPKKLEKYLDKQKAKKKRREERRKRRAAEREAEQQQAGGDEEEEQ